MLIDHWLKQDLDGAITPLRVVATIVAVCNLSCQHCFWHHDLKDEVVEDWTHQAEAIAKWGASVGYAGRMLTPKGLAFLQACLKTGVEKIGIVDHGYTIFNAPLDLLQRLDYINISIDGVKADHDCQRNKVGAFDKAWGAVLKLKDQGFDPIISSCLSPVNLERWTEFEAMLADNDVPLSVAMISRAEAVTERQTALFDDEKSCRRAFDTLLTGVPKIINLYDLAHIEFLVPILKELTWVPDQVEGDCLLAELLSGTQVVYRPQSLLWSGELNLRWDGKFYLPTLDGRMGVIAEPGLEPLGHQQVLKELLTQEMRVWSRIL